jgi:DNA-binding NarL/FixJ family response regulator
MAEDIRLVIVDDHQIVRSGLRKLLALQEGIRVVGEYSSPAEALARLPSVSPDVVLMDVKMPGLDGLAATRELRNRGLGCRVIILTMFDEYLTEALEAGAVGFLRKDVSEQELADAIRRAARGEMAVSASMENREAAPGEKVGAGPQEDGAASGPPVQRVTLRVVAPGGVPQATRFFATLIEHLNATLIQSAGNWDDGAHVRIGLPEAIPLPDLVTQVRKLPHVVWVEKRSEAPEDPHGLFRPLRRRPPHSAKGEVTLLAILKEVETGVAGAREALPVQGGPPPPARR